MNILYLTHDNLDRPYAWRTHILEIIEGLTRKGHFVRLIAPGPIRHFNLANARIYERGVFNYLFGGICAVIKETSKKKFDVLYLRGQHPSLTHFLVCLAYKIPLVVEINGVIEDEMASRPIRRFIYTIINKITFSFASKIVVISESLKDAVAQKSGVPKEKFAVIGNGANPEKIFPMDKEETKNTLGLSAGKTYFLYVSSFYKHHAHITLLDAVSGKDLTDLNFVLLGDGVTKKSVEQEARRRGLLDSFIFCGEIQHELISKYLGACDVAIMLLNTQTNYQWSPLKLFEAMSAARPVLLSSNNENLINFVRDNEIGLSTQLDISKPQNLAGLISKMLQNRDMWQKWGKNGRELILKKYSWEKAVEELETVLKSIT